MGPLRRKVSLITAKGYTLGRNLVARLEYLPQRSMRKLQIFCARMRHRLRIVEADENDVDVAHRFRHPIDVQRRALLVSQYRRRFPNSVALELDEADRIKAHCFDLLGYAVNHGKRIAWSRDPLTGRDWEHGFSFDIAYRGPHRLGDIKFPWELSKHQYFFTLGKSSWLTDDISGAREIMQQIDHWIEQNPLYHGVNWISALEVGQRAVAWIMAYAFYAEHCDGAFRLRLARSLAQHMSFIERNLSTVRSANNHLIGDAAALVVGGLFLDSRHSASWLSKGLKLLEDQLLLQTTADGVHVERSIAYHRFVLDQYYLVSALLSRNGHSFSRATLQSMERMTEFLMDVLWSDGSAPRFGDCDDARGLWLRADCPNEYRSLLALGAVIFGRSDFKAISGGATEEVLWLLGIEGLERFESIPSGGPLHTSGAYSEGGYFIMRAGWERGDAVLVFDCGPLGDKSGAHGHADALSFQLHAGGSSFLVDPGTFSYNIDYLWRNIFRSTRAHNTVVVDGLDQSELGDRMSWKTMAESKCRRWISNEWFDLVDGEHDGYCRLPNPVTHRRIILFIKPDLWIIWDHVRGRGRHQFEALLHLMPECEAKAVMPQSTVILRSEGNAQLFVRMLNGDFEPIMPELILGDHREHAAWFSPRYGSRIPASLLSVQHDFVDEFTLITCISTSDAPGPVFRQQRGDIRMNLRRGAGQQESLFYRIHSANTEQMEGIHFDGNVLYQREETGCPIQIAAAAFHELSVEGLLYVKSSASIDALILNDGRCDIVTKMSQGQNLEITASEAVQVVINGQPKTA